MAFQTGTTVDPRLMMADYSGFAKAAEIEAQGMQNLAAGLSAGVQKFVKKKEKKKADQSATDLLVRFGGSNPALADGLGLDYLDENGQFNEEILQKSAKEFVNTVGSDQIGNTIISTLGLGVKSQSSAAEAARNLREDKFDPKGRENILSQVLSLPDIYRMKDNNITRKSDGAVITPDMPEAEPFLNQPGSGWFDLHTQVAPTPALSVGGGAKPTGEIVEQDGIQYSKFSDGSFRPVN